MAIHTQRIAELLLSAGQISQREKNNFSTMFRCEKIHADGSLRNFVRIVHNKRSVCVAIYPDGSMPRGLAEAHSAVAIGRHLFHKGVPVPQIFGEDESLGLCLVEDCGNVRFHDLILEKRRKNHTFDDEIVDIYCEVIETLLHMQLRGAEDFKPEWCYDTAMYDAKVMIEDESHYFLRSFWSDLLGGQPCDGVEEEFTEIARQAGSGENGYFLHRDFQSRNIMFVGRKLRIIDYQGGRLGPLGYDLASLLIDPYSGLTAALRDKFTEKYTDSLEKSLPLNKDSFMRQFSYLCLQRNLQILGAFSFLYKRRGKPFFKEFIIPSLHMLQNVLREPHMAPYVHLKKIADKAEIRIKTAL